MKSVVKFVVLGSVLGCAVTYAERDAERDAVSLLREDSKNLKAVGQTVDSASRELLALAIGKSAKSDSLARIQEAVKMFLNRSNQQDAIGSELGEKARLFELYQEAKNSNDEDAICPTIAECVKGIQANLDTVLKAWRLSKIDTK